MAIHTYQLVLSYNCSGQFAQNVLHYQFEDSGFSNSALAANALATAFDSFNRAGLLAMIPTHTQFLSLKARGVSMTGGFESVLLVAGTIVGTRTGNVQASGICPVLITYPTGNAKQRGKIFLPGLSDTDCVCGEFSTAFQTAISTNRHIFSDTMVLPGGGGPTATPVIYSRKPLPATSRVIQYVRLSPMVGQMRRRQRPA